MFVHRLKGQTTPQATPVLQPPVPDHTIAPLQPHFFSGSQGGITRQGQGNAVLEYFPVPDEQKEHQACCACRDGSHLAGTHDCLGFGGPAVTTLHLGPEHELVLGPPELV